MEKGVGRENCDGVRFMFTRKCIEKLNRNGKLRARGWIQPPGPGGLRITEGPLRVRKNCGPIHTLQGAAFKLSTVYYLHEDHHQARR